mgnify:CR=1 FL=1
MKKCIPITRSGRPVAAARVEIGIEEVFEAITWTQLGIHDKPVAFLDVAGFYGSLLSFLDRTVEAGFLAPGHRAMIVDASSPESVLDELATWEPVATSKWLTPDER